ncbi:MAG: DMT family transporter [Burkholderiales bacterium]|nr:DMT family transporter [Burkholderiales bacterium]
MPQQFAAGVALTLFAVVTWGAQLPIAKSAFAAVDPYNVSAIRYVVGTLALVPIAALLEGRSALRFYGRGRAASVLGVIGMTCSPLLVFAGLGLTRPEHTAVIVALQPSMTAIADWLVRGRRPAGFTLACIATAFVGVVLVVTKGAPRLALGHDEFVGDGLVLAGALCWVVYTMGTESFRGWSALKLTVLTLIPGSLGLIAATAALAGLGIAHTPSWTDVRAIGGELAFLSFAGVAASMFCWNAGNQRIGALNAMLLINLLPVVTFAIGFAQGARLQPSELAGGAAVIAALASNNVYLRRTRSARRPA